MSGYLYRGRHYGGDRGNRPKSMVNMSDLSSGESEKGPPLHAHSLREFEQHLTDLKKENFSLKLRIYFLEERFQQRFDDSSSEDVHRRNIELKVDVESLKRELQEKQQQLIEAQSAAENLTNDNEAEVERRCEERQLEIRHLQEVLETKVHMLEEEAEQANAKAQKMASELERESQCAKSLERKMVEREKETERECARTQEALAEKDRLIIELRSCMSNSEAQLRVMAEEKSALSEQVQELSASLQQKERDLQFHMVDPGRDQGRTESEMQKLIEEQQTQLGDYERAAGQCVCELQKAQQQVRSLQANIRESEANNQKLQRRLAEMELELRAVREVAQGQESTIGTLGDSLSTTQAQVSDLERVNREQKEMLLSLKSQCHKQQLTKGDALAAEATLFSTQLELQELQRAKSHAHRREEDLVRANQRLQHDLQRALQHRQDTETHNLDLLSALQKVRATLQQLDEQTREKEGERNQEMEEKEKKIRQLKNSLQYKEKLLEDSDMLESAGQKGSGERSRECVIAKLKQRIQERDRALERAVDEKFVCVEQRELEVRKLHLQLREKERDLDKIRCVCANNEETIASIEALLRGKGLELEQVCEALRSAQGIQRDSEERHTISLRERDTLISQLQNSLHTHAKENESLTSSLLSKLTVSPTLIMDELKTRLSLKEKLIQDLLGERSRQAQEHQAQVQDLLNGICARDQYIQESAGRIGEVMNEQTARVQELRRQLVNAQKQDNPADTMTHPNTEALQEDLRLALCREREAQQELSRLKASLSGHNNQLQSQASLLEAPAQSVKVADQHFAATETEQTSQYEAEFAELFSEFEDGDEDEDEEDYASELGYSIDEEEDSSLTAQTLGAMTTTADGVGHLSQDAAVEEVKQLVEQKRAVERELAELRSQLEKSGYSSLSHMRRALASLQAENQQFRDQLFDGPDGPQATNTSSAQLRPLQAKSSCPRPQSLDLGALLSQPAQAEQQVGCVLVSPEEEALRSNLQQVQKKSQDLQERLMVSEATVHAQAEQLKDYRELLTESAVQQDSKHVQVDLQDMGYETCGRSENEADRDDTSSPEFDDLEMCTSLSRVDDTSLWWSGVPSTSAMASTRTQSLSVATVATAATGGAVSTAGGYGRISAMGPSEVEAARLEQLVDELHGQLTSAQSVIRSLQARLRDVTPAGTPRKVSWLSTDAMLGAMGSQDEDEGWQSSSDVGGPTSAATGLSATSNGTPMRLGGPHDRELQDLACRVTSLEEQLRAKGKGHSGVSVGKATNSPGRFDSLIQAQARELCLLRQRTREGSGMCRLLTQHLGDTTKAFEELLRANDVDYYMGQTFREQLAQSSSLALRLSATISGRDPTDLPDDSDKTELLAIRLSKELQQKDKLIESLRSKLEQSRPDTPVSCHALSEGTDQSDRISFVSDEPGSTNADLELGSDLDTPSEFGPEDRSTTGSTNPREASQHASFPPSITSSHHSSRSCFSVHCTPQRAVNTHTGPMAGILPNCPSLAHSRPIPQPLQQPQSLRPRYQDRQGFSLADAQQELHMLQRQLANSKRTGILGSAIKPHTGFPLAGQPQSDSSQFLSVSHHALHHSPLGGVNASPGAGLLESSALWDVTYGARPGRAAVHGDVSSGSSGYQSGTGHAGSDLMEEHLREIRCLRRRLEDSIQTNDRLRQQLEERLASMEREGGVAPTNIYIQGLDSVSQLSTQIRCLKEENYFLQARLDQATREGSREAELLRESLASGRSRVKEAELEMERWAEQCKLLQAKARENTETIQQLTQDKQHQQEEASRLHREVTVLQQQLRESRLLVVSLQNQIQSHQRANQANQHTHHGQTEGSYAKPFDLRDLQPDMQSLHAQLEQQLHTHSARKQLFHDNSSSPPVRDTGPSSPTLASSQPQSTTTEKLCGSVEVSSSGRGDGPLPSPTGQHVVGHTSDYTSLLQQLLEGKVIISKMEAMLQATGPNKLQQGSVRNLLTNTKSLKTVLEEARSLLSGFWKASLPRDAHSLQSAKDEEIADLKRKLQEQQQSLRDTLENLKASNQTRDSMENFITSQLTRTRDVLKKARSNLEKNELKLSSLSPSSSSSPPSSSPPSYPTFSTPSRSSKGEISEHPRERTCTPGWGFVTPRVREKPQGTSFPLAYQQRPLEAYSY